MKEALGVIAILGALVFLVCGAVALLAWLFDPGLECDEDEIVVEPKDYDADAEAISGVAICHPANRLTMNSRQVS
jgi:hypothetical protein